MQEAQASGFATGAEAESYGRTLAQSVVDCTKHANALPSGRDFEYFESFPAFKDRVSGEAGGRILNLIERLMAHQLPNANPANMKSMDSEEQFEAVVDFSDSQRERVDAFIDEANGLGPSVNIQRWAPAQGRLDRNKSYSRVLEASAMVKPQLKFESKVDNSNMSFVPKVHPKIHIADPSAPRLYEPKVDHGCRTHPYEHEICSLRYLERHLAEGDEVKPKPLDQTACTWVDNPFLLQELVNTLSNVTEFAVDLENHSVRSFQGFVCLMQISTRKADYLVDTLELRSHMHDYLVDTVEVSLRLWSCPLD